MPVLYGELVILKRSEIVALANYYKLEVNSDSGMRKGDAQRVE